MAINSSMTPTLDYTPPSTFLTLQFSSEPLNIIAISLLAGWILANIGSLTSKLLHLAPPNTFTYHSWLRAIIFASTDDPLRILSWVRRRYIYPDRSLLRSSSKLRPTRLLVPLCARAFLLFVSIALVAVSIPVTTLVSGCQSVDYSPVWNISKVSSVPLPPASCNAIQLRSTIGEVLSVAEYCYSLSEVPVDFSADQGQTIVVVGKTERTGLTYTVFYSSISNAAWSVGFHIQWRRLNDSAVAYTSDIRNLDVVTQLDISIAAIQSVRPDCLAAPTVNDSDANVIFAVTTLSCELSLGFTGLDDFKIDPYLRQVIAYYFTGIQWQRSDSIQRRIRTTDSDSPFEYSYECPVLVAINQPVLNIVPLAIILGLSILANVITTLTTRGHGNALDSGYHIVKESLGHDTTTNPLEENADCEKITAVEIGRWRCTTGGEGHIGFIGRPGDVPVDEFDECTVVAQCVRAERDLEASQRLRSKIREAV